MLNNMNKCAGVAETVTIKMGEEVPFCVDFRMTINDPTLDPGDEPQKIALGMLRFYIAPRMESDDDGGMNDDDL